MELGRGAKAARPSEVMHSQREVIRQQDELIEVLKGALAASGLSAVPTHAGWMSGLSPQERALVGVLYARYPQPVRREVALELLPGNDHARERQLQVVDVLVHKLRKKLGGEAVITERGAGFRLGSAFYERTPKLNLDVDKSPGVALERASFDERTPGVRTWATP